jgi:3-deoxy-manno-octulosonate cytidylyltransferase (CMP-KDO synthetase)
MGASDMKVVGVIPARWASTRLPGKPLRPILGRPLIHWVIERARLARNLADVIVACDDQRIAAAAAEIGCAAVMTSAEHPSGTDRVAEAVRTLDAEVVVNIQGDEPMVDPTLVDALAAALRDDAGGWDMVTAAAPIAAREDLINPNIVKVVCAADGAALYFSRSPIPHVREQEDWEQSVHWRHIGLYGYRREFLERLVAAPPCMLERAEKLEQLRALYIGARIRVIETGDVGIGVDTPDDVEKVEAILKSIGEHM